MFKDDFLFAGVELRASGRYAAKCFDGYWWAGPSCRSDTSKRLGPHLAEAVEFTSHRVGHWLINHQDQARPKASGEHATQWRYSFGVRFGVIQSVELRCFPIVTAGTGWRMHAIMNWVGVYGFPAALGVSNLWKDFTRHVRELRVLFYWCRGTDTSSA